jgi:transcription elongation factor GreA
MESLDKLKRETSEKIRDAASHGDLKENAEYHAAREEQSLIVYKKQLMQSHTPFQIIENSDIETDKVGFGNKVTIREEGKDEAEEYYLLGPIEFELDLYPMIATYHSPFGRAIVGKKIDENFTLEIQGKKTKFTITAIEKISAK